MSNKSSYQIRNPLITVALPSKHASSDVSSFYNKQCQGWNWALTLRRNWWHKFIEVWLSTQGILRVVLLRTKKMQMAEILPMRWDYNDSFGFPQFLKFYHPLVVWVMLIALPEAQTWCADNSRWPCNNVACFRHKSKPVRPYLCVAIVVSRPVSRECPRTSNTLFLVYSECPMEKSATRKGGACWFIVNARCCINMGLIPIR
jgi:hypothetical protein